MSATSSFLWLVHNAHCTIYYYTTPGFSGKLKREKRNKNKNTQETMFALHERTSQLKQPRRRRKLQQKKKKKETHDQKKQWQEYALPTTIARQVMKTEMAATNEPVSVQAMPIKSVDLSLASNRCVRQCTWWCINIYTRGIYIECFVFVLDKRMDSRYCCSVDYNICHTSMQVNPTLSTLVVSLSPQFPISHTHIPCTKHAFGTSNAMSSARYLFTATPIRPRTFYQKLSRSLCQPCVFPTFSFSMRRHPPNSFILSVLPVRTTTVYMCGPLVLVSPMNTPTRTYTRNTKPIHHPNIIYDMSANVCTIMHSHIVWVCVRACCIRGRSGRRLMPYKETEETSRAATFAQRPKYTIIYVVDTCPE